MRLGVDHYSATRSKSVNPSRRCVVNYEMRVVEREGEAPAEPVGPPGGFWAVKDRPPGAARQPAQEPIPISVARVCNPCVSPVENRCHKGLWDLGSNECSPTTSRKNGWTGGRRIYNCSPDTNLDCFERVTLEWAVKQ